MVLVPAGARDIVIQEVEEAANFLAVRAADSDKYYLNGNYIIQWNGEYQVGGVKFYYERSGNLENLTSPGPTTEPIIVQLLFQETNPGVRYEFIVQKNSSADNDLVEPQYRWKYGAWTDCSATCGQGEQQQPVRCFRAGVGVVDEELCDQNTRPEDRHRHCKNMDCPARTVAGEERVLHPGDCRKLPKPKAALTCNRNVTCGTAWAVGNWSECSLTCGGGVKSRSVKCVIEPQIRCDPVTRPRSTTFCNLQSCSRTRPQPPTLTPSHDPNDLTSNPTPTPYTPTTSASHTPTPSVLHKDDQEFILVTNSSVVDDTHTGQNQDQDQEEEGSTDLQQPPDGSPYTPGYDYIMEDGREDVFTLHTPFSTCSTSCGLGAVWRSVVCSSGQDSDCSSTAKPEPAHHCNLQPCAVWRKCSQSCGGGLMERSVFCPEPERCDASLRPESSAPCNLQPCVWWVTEPWQQCSKSCGGGVQKRVIRCVSGGSAEEVKSSLCPRNDEPESLRACAEEQCRPERGVPVCKRDSVSTRFCSTLKLLGRCVLDSVRKQCCLTCAM
ncbi:hypothetical protein AMELA_G00243010 [Ameiurus melas]|uniref:PLAC domain-containing protein n=1 Tax=Ameiurus melas TaxID=219545 RepID=A0A7J5ZXV0_AMEME|nr:hypothetical protein AMELA_G00243010 [Ameiurus melas]